MSDPPPHAPSSSCAAAPTARFSTRVRVRYAETDADGVVYYANYLTYFEVARVELLRSLGVGITALLSRGVLLPVVEARVKYLRPAHLDDVLEVSLEVASVGPASFSFDYEVRRDDGLLLATGFTRLAVCERDTGRAVRVPPWLRELFARSRGAGEDE